MNKPRVSATEVSSIPYIIIKNWHRQDNSGGRKQNKRCKEDDSPCEFLFPIELPPSYERDHPNLNKNLPHHFRPRRFVPTPRCALRSYLLPAHMLRLSSKSTNLPSQELPDTPPTPSPFTWPTPSPLHRFPKGCPTSLSSSAYTCLPQEYPSPSIQESCGGDMYLSPLNHPFTKSSRNTKAPHPTM